jgi:hypothetical protein
MQTLGSPASVVAAIHEDADAEVERIQQSTATEIASLRSDATNANVAIADREEQLAAARRQGEERIARQEWEGRRAVMQQRETWMQRVVAAGQERWASISTEALEPLTRDARAHLPAGDCEVIVNPRGGCVVRAGDLSFDNSFDARSQRLEPEWRGALGGMYKP